MSARQAAIEITSTAICWHQDFAVTNDVTYCPVPPPYLHSPQTSCSPDHSPDRSQPFTYHQVWRKAVFTTWSVLSDTFSLMHWFKSLETRVQFPRIGPLTCRILLLFLAAELAADSLSVRREDVYSVRVWYITVTVVFCRCRQAANSRHGASGHDSVSDFISDGIQMHRFRLQFHPIVLHLI